VVWQQFFTPSLLWLVHPEALAIESLTGKKTQRAPNAALEWQAKIEYWSKML